MAFQKIFAWILIALGIVIIVFSLWSSYQIFTDKKAVPEIFESPEKEVVLPKKKTATPEQEIEQAIEKTISEQLSQVLPADSLPKLFNLISWSIFAWILILGGAKISGLGIILITKQNKE